VDHRLYREYGRAPKGERIYEAVAGKGRERTSIISASQQGKLVAPLVFQGSCNTEVVDVYFAQGLPPELSVGSVIVLDNARFHQVTHDAAVSRSCGLPVALSARLFARSQSHRTPVGNPENPPPQRPRHRRQPLPFYRQYVPMLFVIVNYYIPRVAAGAATLGWMVQIPWGFIWPPWLTAWPLPIPAGSSWRGWLRLGCLISSG
jgi:DDE superfamily endonuclease